MIEKKFFNFNLPSYKYLGLFTVFLLISTILAPDPQTAWIGLATRIVYSTGLEGNIFHANVYRLSGFFTYLFCIILFLLASQESKHNIDKLLRLMILTAVVVSSIALLQYFSILPPGEPKFSFGTLGNRNFFGTYVVFVLPAAILFFIYQGKKLWLFSSAFIYAGLLVSQTRGVWLSFAVFLVIIAYHHIKNRRPFKPVILMLITMSIITILLSFSNDQLLLKRAFSITDEVTATVQLVDDAGSSRMYIWKETLKVLPDNWAFGMGPDHLFYAEIVTKNGSIVTKAHNIFLEIAVTMGIFSLAFYLLFLGSILLVTKNNFVFFTMIFSYLFQGLFNIDVIMVMPLFYIILGLAIANQNSGVLSS